MNAKFAHFTLVSIALGGLATSDPLTTDVRAQDKPAAQKPTAGFPAADEVQRAYDEADLNRAIQAPKFSYPTVSGAAKRLRFLPLP